MDSVTLKKKLQARKQAPITERENDTGPVLKRLITYMIGKDNTRRFAGAMGLRFAAVVALVFVPTLTGQAINVLSTPNGAVADLAGWLGLAVVAIAVYITTASFAEREFARLATYGLYRLQRDLFEHIQKLSLSFFDRQPIGELMSRVTNDSENVAVFYESAVAQIIRAVFQIALVAVLMVLVEWQLALVVLLLIPVMLLLTSVIQRISMPAFIQLQEELGRLGGFQEETIAGNKVITTNRRQDWAIAASDSLAGNVYDVANKAFFTAMLQFPVTMTMVMFTTAAVLMVGALMIVAQSTTVGVVIAFTGYAALLSSPLSDIANLTATALSAVAGGRRVFAIIDEQPTVVDTPDAQPLEFKGGHVEFKDVDFSYVKNRKILKHNTFEARPGEMIGICGPTGAGKSTIINILTRYYDLDSGAILIDGQDISLMTQDSLRKQVGVVLQEAFLFSDTVMNNLKYAREGATDQECIEAARQANADEFIMNLPQGYDTMMTERGANLSQGQRQMITIARAMVANPKILVLDEATSNVDTRTEKLIQEGLRRLMAGKTSFVIAHRLSTIRNAAKIMVVNGGEIVEMGSHDELMARQGFYHTLYMSQFKGKGPAGASADAGKSSFITT